jgi:nitronate monooxygenase
MTSWRHTALSQRLGLDYPIIQGPFGGGLSSTSLVAAVSNAGGLGSFGAHLLSGNEIRALAREIRSRTSRSFNLNLWVPLPGEPTLTLTAAEFQQEAERLQPLRAELAVAPPERPTTYAGPSFSEQLEAVIEARPAVASFVFGPPPTEAIADLKRRGTTVMVAATTVDEAVHLEAAGVDFIIASGSDAGGHRPSFLRPADESLVGTFSLVPQIVDAVRVPVIAAGGIADARGIRAAMTLGAAGVQIGTAFLACDESNATDAHKQALTGAGARDTRLTHVFTGRLARGIANPLLLDLERIEPRPPPYPLRAWFMSPLTRAAAQAGDSDRQCLWAGQAAPLAQRRPAGEFVRTLVAAIDTAT